MVQGPRRIGKTMLILKSVPKATLIETSLYGMRNAQACLSEIGRSVEHWLGKPLKKGKRTAELKFGVERFLEARLLSESAPQELHLHDLFRAVHDAGKRKGICPVIFVDEVQSLMECDEGPDFARRLRTAIQDHMDGLSVVMAGSNSTLMRELHADQKAPFYKQVTPLSVGPLPRNEFLEWINKRLVQYDFAPMSQEVFDALADFCRDIPGDIQRVLHEATNMRQSGKVDADLIDQTIDSIMRQSAEEHHALLRSLTDNQMRLLIFLVVRDRYARDTPITGVLAKKAMGLPAGTIRTSMQSLVIRGILALWKDRVFPDNPFFGQLLISRNPDLWQRMRSMLD